MNSNLQAGEKPQQRFDLAQSVSLSVLLWVKSREETRPVPPLSLSSQKRHAMLIVCLCVWSGSPVIYAVFLGAACSLVVHMRPIDGFHLHRREGVPKNSRIFRLD